MTSGKKWRPDTSMSVEIAELHAAPGREQRAIVADAERRLRLIARVCWQKRGGGLREISFDQGKL